jgi:hypothetical protein
MTVLKKNEADLMQTAQEFAQSQVAPNDPAREHDRRIGLDTIQEEVS